MTNEILVIDDNTDIRILISSIFIGLTLSAEYEIGDFVDTKIIRRETLYEGKFIEGPIIVEEPQSTISIQPGWYGSIDQVGNIILDSKGL